MIREARKEETEELAELVYIIIEGMELPVTEEYSKEELTDALAEAMKEEQYRYSYRNGLVCERDGQIAGVCFGYKGELEPVIDQALKKVVEKKGFDTDTFKVSITRETYPGEWYLDSIVTHPDFRRQGVGSELMAAVPERAREEGETLIGLNCDRDNTVAKALYEKQGFVVAGERKLGPFWYDHMQKQVN